MYPRAKKMGTCVCEMEKGAWGKMVSRDQKRMRPNEIDPFISRPHPMNVTVVLLQ